MVEPSVIHGMLDELRFEEAERLVEQNRADQALRDEVARRRAEAEERAKSLADRIIELGDERNFDEIIRLAEDPDTRPLIDLLPDSVRKRPDLYLREAARWEERRRETNERRLTEARRALDGLDLELARGLMNRIDGRFLTEEQTEERDQILLEISARAMELEALSDTGDELIERQEPNRGSRGEQPWWRRWFS